MRLTFAMWSMDHAVDISKYANGNTRVVVVFDAGFVEEMLEISINTDIPLAEGVFYPGGSDSIVPIMMNHDMFILAEGYPEYNGMRAVRLNVAAIDGCEYF